MESSYYVDRSKAEKRINSFLKIQRHAVENKAIRLNTEGINYKLQPWVDYDPNKVDSGDYEGSPFDKIVIASLPNKIPRLDMLPMFQFYMAN